MDYKVQAALDAEHHQIVAQDVTNDGHDRAQLTTMAKKAQDALGTTGMTVLADLGYFNAMEILECKQAGIVPLVPKPLTSNSKAESRLDKREFIYNPATDEYECPAGEHAIHRFASGGDGLTLHNYWSSACPQFKGIFCEMDRDGSSIHGSGLPQLGVNFSIQAATASPRGLTQALGVKTTGRPHLAATDETACVHTPAAIKFTNQRGSDQCPQRIPAIDTDGANQGMASPVDSDGACHSSCARILCRDTNTSPINPPTGSSRTVAFDFRPNLSGAIGCGLLSPCIWED